MTTLYTVTNANTGEEIVTSQTAAEAMNVILTDDGHQYEIRPEADGEGYRLWTSANSRNSTAWNGLSKSPIFSLAADKATAEREIAEKVIAAAWPGKPEAFTDESYAAMQAQLARNEVMALALLNRAALIDTVKAAHKCQKADVDADGDIWIADPQTGRWLTGDELAKIVRDCGVRRKLAAGLRSMFPARDT